MSYSHPRTECASTRSVSGTPNARYLYDGLNLVQEQNGTGTVLANTLSGPGLDQVYRRTEAAGNRNFLTDAQGSVIALSDGAATPTVPKSYTYAPYGAQTTTGTASTNPFGFTGREADQTSGLQYNRARYLSPAMGRFISEDPIGIAGGMNVYGYANQAPTVFGDPLGLDPGGPGVSFMASLLSIIGFGIAFGLLFALGPPGASLGFLLLGQASQAIALLGFAFAAASGSLPNALASAFFFGIAMAGTFWLPPTAGVIFLLIVSGAKVGRNIQFLVAGENP